LNSMGAKIKSVDIARAGFTHRGSVDLEARAAEKCLKKAAVDPNQVGFLINAGIYRDRHMVEPAMSSFIQKRIGANEEFKGGSSTFSFDLTNGGCGMLTAIMVADGFLRSGLTAYSLVVAGDAEPVPGLSKGFDIAPTAAAVLLMPGEDDQGFIAFQTDTDTQYLDSFRVRMEWTGEQKRRNWLVFRSTPAYVDECADCAMRALQTFQEQNALPSRDIDLLLPSQSPPGFVAGLRQRSGLGDRIMDVTGDYGNTHTAGIGMALHHAIQDGRFDKARRIVFLTVGAGITTTLALYRNR